MMNFKRTRGSCERRKTGKFSSCVRLHDGRKFEHRFNRVFPTEAQRNLFYDYIKRYEKELRGGGDGVKTLNFPDFAESNPLIPLPPDFQKYEDTMKVQTLNKLIVRQVNHGAKVIEKYEVNHHPDRHVDEGSAADQSPEDSVNPSHFSDDNPLQHCAPKQQGCSRGEMVMLLLKKLGDGTPTRLSPRDICEGLRVDSINTRTRSREEEIFSQLCEDVTPEDPLIELSEPLVEASDFGEDVSWGAKNIGSSMSVEEQLAAIDYLPTNSKLPPGQDFSDVFKLVPDLRGRLRTDEADIHPQVEYQPIKPKMEGVGFQASHSPTIHPLEDMQVLGNANAMTYCGVKNSSPIVDEGNLVSAEPSHAIPDLFDPNMGVPSTLDPNAWDMFDSEASYPQAIGFGADGQWVEKNIGSIMSREDQNDCLQRVAMDPGPSTWQWPPDQAVFEGLKSLPSNTGRLRSNEADIQPRLQYQPSELMIEGFGIDANHRQSVSPSCDLKVCEELSTMPYFGVNSLSQFAGRVNLVSLEPSHSIPDSVLQNSGVHATEDQNHSCSPSLDIADYWDGVIEDLSFRDVYNTVEL